MRTLYTHETGTLKSKKISIGTIASLVKQWTTPKQLGGESLGATGKWWSSGKQIQLQAHVESSYRDHMGSRCNEWANGYSTTARRQQRCMETANSPHASVQVDSAGNSWITTAHLPHTAQVASNMLNPILEETKRAQAKFQMCSAHLSQCLNITHGTDIWSHYRQTGTAGFSTF